MNIRQCACVRLGEAVQILTAGLRDDVVRDCFSVPQAQTRNAENGDDRGSSMNCLKKCLASDPVHGAAWGDVSPCQQTSDHAARCGCDSLAQVTRARLSDQGKSPTAGKRCCARWYAAGSTGSRSRHGLRQSTPSEEPYVAGAGGCFSDANPGAGLPGLGPSNSF